MDGLAISTDGGNSFVNNTAICNGLGYDTINGIFVDANGYIYAATNGGLSRSPTTF